MKFKIQLPNAIKIFLFLFLVFWIFAWNLPADSDLSCGLTCSSCKETDFTDVSYSKSDDFSIKSNVEENYNPLTSSILIPSFKEWREMELAKHEIKMTKDRNSHQQRKFIRRKLNYASSKCGAKILASNPEARHRTAVLSEKSDEYFLNPCRVTTWFVIELCDAVEATEVELANYELYSSSPKEFSVFLSDVYPSLLWHHLGTFVAEDKRTMQTFNVSGKNMGKFIKVIIHSHHGKEHYCPLSVIRVLGYSMVQTLEDIEHEERNIDSDFNIQTEVNFSKTSPSKSQNVNKAERSIILKKNAYTKYFCAKLSTYCSTAYNVNITHHCLNIPACRFFGEIMKISDVNCLEYYCPIYPASFLISFNSTLLEKIKTNSSNLSELEKEKLKSNFNNYLDENDIIKDYEHKKSLRIKEERKIHASAKLKENYEILNNKIGTCCDNDKIKNDENEIKLDSDKAKYLYDEIIRMPKTKCVLCDNDKSESEPLREMKVTTKGNFFKEHKEKEMDTAGLINKESVLFKLAARIKTSETDLNLINRYLQQLSQSYRHQIDDMNTRLNKTFQTLIRTSDKTNEVNVKQERNINQLKGKIEVLNRKINFLMKGKNELTKRVIELHGFFLILEIIIIATVFNVFLNIFNKRNASYDHRTSNLNR